MTLVANRTYLNRTFKAEPPLFRYLTIFCLSYMREPNVSDAEASLRQQGLSYLAAGLLADG